MLVGPITVIALIEAPETYPARLAPWHDRVYLGPSPRQRNPVAECRHPAAHRLRIDPDMDSRLKRNL